MTTKSLKEHVSHADIAKYRQLFNSVRAGDGQVVRMLLDQGMNVNLKGPRGATPLHIAARFGQTDMVDLLLSYGADASSRDDSGKSPSDKARASGAHRSMVAMLTDSLAAKFPSSEETSQPSNFSPCVRSASAVGASSVNASVSVTAAQQQRSAGASCRKLLESAYRGETERLEKILNDEPGLVNQPGPRGATALHIAARYGHPSCVLLLLRSRADPLSRDGKGNTPIDKVFCITCPSYRNLASDDI